MNFLISDDDGVHAPGLLASYHTLLTIGEVVVVATNAEKSGSASALNIAQPLYTYQLASGFVAVNGSPANCVYLVLHQLYHDTHFDCVITGINSGSNLGRDVLFSGTLRAALTAHIFGIPAIATSLVGGAVKGNGQGYMSHYQLAANEIVKLLTDILEAFNSLPYHVLNVNIPDVQTADDIKARKITSLGHSHIARARPVHHVVDLRGHDAYWLSLRKCQLELPTNTTTQRPMSPTLPIGVEFKSSVIKSANGLFAQSVHTDDQALAA